MPKSKLEDAFFSILMASIMAYAMELYNLALNKGGLSNSLFLEVFKDVFLMAIVVIIVEKLIAGRTARVLAFKLFSSEKDKAIFIILAIQCFTVCFMCPIMSLIATILFKHSGSEIISIWLQTTVLNFPLAFFWQVFFAGPLVRFIFRKVFKPTN